MQRLRQKKTNKKKSHLKPSVSQKASEIALFYTKHKNSTRGVHSD
jgi:hypothetical protein